ncbi:Stk1 family PASTA domain-containing Ser/Thr kinase [Homoserinibacter sp. YIM 151385]|uniref:Stk1 family PASTA domain-containing Ser/Thr kinase n=1 Tax=Homoserinibacter sp. YIM 151385 TaxID=2985506 RepID=UPI003FA5DED5
MIGRLIDGRYQVRSRIARGGMATVYLATDLRLERRVAIKIMHGHLADDTQFKQRFIQEARSAARLAHPNVVNVFDQGQDHDSAYLVMEYLPGITLRELLHDYGALTSEQAIDIAEAVLSGLSAAHKAGIVHRDLKPENVLLADDGRIKIGDFGLARAASANTATGQALLGTIAYLSPELVTRGVADTRSDIYAVGIMLFEMLTGEQPFKGEQPMQIAYQHANDSVPPPSRRNPKVPAELDELVLWATARDPEERPVDARALLEQLHETESLLQTALPTSATQVQRTMVLPSAPAMPAPSDQATQVLGGAGALVPQQHRTDEIGDSTSALAVQSRKRRRRGPIIILIVLLLAIAGGVAGWWFSAGPGALVVVPQEIRGMTFEDAKAELEQRGLTVQEEPGDAVFDIEIEPELVAQSDPSFGIPAAKDAPIVLHLSKGPEPKAMTIERGMPEPEAQAIVDEANWTAEEPDRRFANKVPEGQVIDVLDGEGDSLLETEEYGEGLPVQLVVSLGPVPDVRGLSFEEAAQRLRQAGLTAVEGERRFSSDYEEGQVSAIVTTTGGTQIVFREGDRITLVISRGPDLVDIPDVVGSSINDAAAALREADFEVQIETNAPEGLWGIATVQEVVPSQDERAERGATITIRANF